MLSDNDAVVRVLIPAIAVFFLIWCVIGVAVGACLIVSSTKMYRRLGALNGYVSTRFHLKSLSIPHEVGMGVRSHRRLIGICIALSAVYSIYGLIAWFDTPSIVTSLKVSNQMTLIAAWAVDSMRWFLLLFSVFALLVGAALVWFPVAFGRFEAWANRWVSGRKLVAGGDKMYKPVDKLVETFPRSSGSIILLVSLYGAAGAASIWARFS